MPWRPRQIGAMDSRAETSVPQLPPLSATTSNDYTASSAPLSAASTAAPHHPYDGSSHSSEQSFGFGKTSVVVSRPAGSATHSSESSFPVNDYWPKVDSDESDEGCPADDLEEPAKPKKTSTSKRFFRYLSKKLGTTPPRYGYFQNDEREHDRNEIQHRVIFDLYEDRFHLAPVINPKRVLDVGTGPGTWAAEFARLHPSSKVIGIDIDPIRRPSGTTRNCSFKVMDVTKEWMFEEGFDFIHVRMLGDLQPKDHLINSIYNNLNPGGWVEFSEWIVHVQSPDHSLDGGAFVKWNRHLHMGLRALGSSVFYPLDLRPLLLQVGFINVQESKYAAPTNPCYPGKRIQRIGTMMTRNWLAVLDQITGPVFGAMGWTQSSIDLLLEDVRKEITDTNFHSYMTLLNVVCQKPIGGSATSSKISFG